MSSWIINEFAQKIAFFSKNIRLFNLKPIRRWINEFAPPPTHIYQGVKRVKNDPRSLNRVSEHVEIKDPSLKYRKNKNI